jgi:hypothetical protein
MGSIFDLPRSSEQAVVGRILTAVHIAIDHHFPSAQRASNRFSRTAFDQPEQTKILRIPSEESQPFGVSQLEDHDAGDDRPPLLWILVGIAVILGLLGIFLAL